MRFLLSQVTLYSGVLVAEVAVEAVGRGKVVPVVRPRQVVWHLRSLPLLQSSSRTGISQAEGT